jgi:hypothetical protein
MRWPGYAIRIGQTRTIYKVLVGKPEDMRPLTKPRCRGEDNIKMELNETEFDGVIWLSGCTSLSEFLDRLSDY